MDPRLLAFWWQRQGLSGALAGATPAEVLARTGWVRSVGGSAPYLALWARAGLGRAAVDAAVADGSICELPAVRGCTYVVPAADYAVALRAGAGAPEGEIAMARKHLGVTDQELDRLGQAVLDATDRAALDPRELKDVLGDKVRSLGEAGKKRGTTTTLPLVLGRLQALGELRRIPIGGRLDQQRYRYARWRPNPLAKGTIAPDELAVALARRYFGWIGAATPAQLGWWSALPAKDCKEAIAALGLLPAGEGGLLALPDDCEAIAAARAPAKAHVGFVASLDNLFHLRRQAGALADDSDGARKVWGEKGPQAVSSVVDSEHHAIVDRGRLVGVWEYDPGAAAVVWATFGKVPGAAAVAKELGAYVASDLGDVRSVSLDSPESRADRLAAIRKMG